jgi:hypothetical protein
MSNYAESKKRIEEIRSKDEIMFRMAISHLMDVGIRHLTEENIQNSCAELRKRDDSSSFMTNQYMCDLVIMAGELAGISHIDLLVYIQREVDFDVFDGAVSYKRAIGLLKNCMAWTIEEVPDSTTAKEEFDCIGFTDDEIEALGFSYLIDFEEE